MQSTNDLVFNFSLLGWCSCVTDYWNMVNV
jgi:hypothetical protein